MNYYRSTKKPRASFSLLPLKLIETDHDRHSLETAVSTFYRRTKAKFQFLQSVWKLRLTLSWQRPLSYRNQSIDLLRKSMDWFLYDNGLSHEKVKLEQVLSKSKN